MSIFDAISEAIATSNPPPPNESTTCEWIIYPLLLAGGYPRRELVSRIADNKGQYPDYCIMSDSPYAWYLEAKPWSVELEDKHALQSLNYANQNGRRWVVLSNGRQWRLYDNRVEGTGNDKLMASAQLHDLREIEYFLQAISKPSVMAGRLEDYATQSKLRSTLSDQLHDENSEIIKAVWSLLKRQPSLNSVTRQALVSYFASNNSVATVNATADRPAILEAVNSHALSSEIALDDLRRDAHLYVTGKQPAATLLPNGNLMPTIYWSEVTREVIKWLVASDKLPELPYRGRPTGKTYFINSSPQHSTGMMRNPIRITVQNQSLFIDVNRNGAELVTRLVELVELVGMSPSTIKVKIKV